MRTDKQEVVPSIGAPFGLTFDVISENVRYSSFPVLNA